MTQTRPSPRDDPPSLPLLLAAAVPVLLAGCLGTLDDPPSSSDVEGTSTPEAVPDPTQPLPRANDTGLPVLPLEPVKVSDGAEPSLLADEDGKWIWLADSSGGYRTENNGSTWEEMPSPFLLTADGWSLAQDAAGNLYAATTNVPSIEVHRSEDDGASWARTSRFADAAPVADRPWIAAGEAGEVALFFYDFGRTNSENCVRSTDGGLTWTDRRPLTGQPNAGGAAYEDDGDFYYVGGDGVLHRFTGTCLGGSETVQMFPEGFGATGMLDVDAAGGAVYTAAPTPSNGAVVLSSSQEAGEPRTLTVSPPAAASNTYPTVSARNGTAVVAWYGSQTPGNPDRADYDGTWHVYLAVVDGFWTEDPSVRVAQLTSVPNHVGGICMGGVSCGEDRDRDLLDYFRVEQDRWGGVHVAYGHDGDSENAEVRYKHVPPAWLERMPRLGSVAGSGSGQGGS